MFWGLGRWELIKKKKDEEGFYSGKLLSVTIASSKQIPFSNVTFPPQAYSTNSSQTGLRESVSYFLP